MIQFDELRVQLFNVMSIKKISTGELDVQAYPVHSENENDEPESWLEFLDAFEWVIVEHDESQSTLFTMPLVINLPVTNMQVSVHFEAEISPATRFTAEQQKYVTDRYEHALNPETTNGTAKPRSATNA
jgi:hypothetical protein